MTFREYYIDQFRIFAFCCRHAKTVRHWQSIAITIPFLFDPLSVYTMYLYDTGKLKVDRKYMEKRKSDIKT